MLVDSVSMLGRINRLDCNISYLYALCYKTQRIHFNLLRRYVHECSFVFGEFVNTAFFPRSLGQTPKMRYKPHRKYKMTECQNVNDGRC